MEVTNCIICDNTLNSGYNAEPLIEGICCDDCNWNYVLPVRIANTYLPFNPTNCEAQKDEAIRKVNAIMRQKKLNKILP